MNKELDKAINLHRKGLLEKAEKIYLEILNIDKKNSYVLQLIGTLYLQKKILTCQKSIYYIVSNMIPKTLVR